MVLKPKSWKSHIPAKPMSPCNSTLGILAGSRFITHQFFLTNRSLFLLAWHARMGFDVGKLYYWLDTLTALAPDSPVLLVATHIDERDADIPLTELRRHYPQTISMSFKLNTLPAGIPTWFIARAHRFSTNTHWRSGFEAKVFVGTYSQKLLPRKRFEHENHLALVQAAERDRMVQLTVCGPNPPNFFALRWS